VTPLLVTISIVSLAGALQLYARKEAAAGTTPWRVPLSGWIWLLIMVAASLATGLLLEWFASNLGRFL
jgi:hypothetical protein